jgi:hypothetical protein
VNVIPFPVPQRPELFVSIFAYVLGKETDDPARAIEKEIELGERASWPAFRTLARIREQVWPIQLQVTHSTLIGKARSLALGAFLESGAPKWISIDDDVEASAEDVAQLLAAEDVDVLLAPCALRGEKSPRLNVVVEGSVRLRLAGKVRVFEVEFGGFALSLVTRDAAENLARAYPELRFVDPHEGPGLGIFLEQIINGAWWGEDYAACKRMHWAGRRTDALCDTAVTHAGVVVTVDPHFFSDTLETMSTNDPYRRDEPPCPPPPRPPEHVVPLPPLPPQVADPVAPIAPMTSDPPDRRLPRPDDEPE